MSVVKSGWHGPMQGHSLGAARVNNLARHGLISQAYTLSLPAFAYPVAGSRSVCGSGDAICGGAIISMLRPNTKIVETPSSWNVVGENHTYSTVEGYRSRWWGM